MATIKWQIENMKREITQGSNSNVVTFLHWVCTANGTDIMKSASSMGKLKVSLGSGDFIPYEVNRRNSNSMGKRCFRL